MGRVRVKMCGLVRPEDAAAAVELGAEYLGFVFAEGSQRQVSLDQVLELLGRVETRDTLRVGVFRDQPAMWINRVVQRCRLDLVQLHGREPRDFASAIRVPVIRVLRVPAPDARRGSPAPGVEHRGASAAPPAVFPLAPNVQAVLLDAEDATGRSGGLGLAPELAVLVEARDRCPEDTRVFVSGGLTPENVAERVRVLYPWAVDVASGVESSPGIKDHRRMAAFVAALEKTG